MRVPWSPVAPATDFNRTYLAASKCL